IQKSGRTGWYYRVLKEGYIEGDSMMVLKERPYPEWTIQICNQIMHERKKDLEASASLAACPLLAPNWKRRLDKRMEGRESRIENVLELLWLYNALIMVLIIFLVNVVYVSSSTIRMILTMKGRPYIAALVSTIEVILYVIGLSLVLDNLDGIQNIAAYAGGYALGIIVGSHLEDRLALGYITINVVSSNPELNFTS